MVIGDLAYTAIGPRLVIWDAANPNAVAKLGETEPFSGLVRALAVVGDRAYVAEAWDLDGRLHVVDVSDPAAPTVIGEIDYTNNQFSRPTSMVANAQRLYLADLEVGLFAFDLADPDDPEIVASSSDTGVTEIELAGGRLYSMSSGFIGTSIHAHDPDTLDWIGGSSVAQSVDFDVGDDNIVVLTGGFGAELWDFADPTQAKLLRSDGQLMAHGVEIVGDRAYVINANGIYEYDLGQALIADPVVHNVKLPRAVTIAEGDASMLVLSEIASGAFVDLGGAAPTLGGRFSLPACVDCTAVAAHGDDLVVADFYIGGRVIDDDTLDLIGRMDAFAPMTGFEDVATRGDLALMASWATGLHLFDISDPAAPTQLANLTTAGYPSAVGVIDDLAFVGESTDGGNLRVIDVELPDQPSEVAALQTSKVRGLATEGGLVYLADEDTFAIGGMRIVDPTEAQNPVVIGHYTTCGSAIGVAVEGALAAVACTDGSFHLVDVSDPSNPTQITTYSPEGATTANAVALAGDRGYFANERGVERVDLSDPANPTAIASVQTAAAARRVAATEDGVAIATGLAGLYRWRFE